MQINRRFYIDMILVLALAGIGFAYRDKVSSFLRRQYLQVRPCVSPIRYSVGEIDPRFGLSSTTARIDVEKALAIWEKAADRNLFEYSTSSDDADLHVDYIYDYRQKATDRLADINSTINASKAAYDELNATYAARTATYETGKKKLEALVAEYKKDSDTYQKEVTYWNGHGGAPEKDHARLEKVRADLTVQQEAIIGLQTSLNESVGTINADANTLNDWAKELNLNVKTYNTVGASAGREFEEGEYVSTASSQEIRIYQFSDRTKLVRVLAHEFGHALGLDHVENPKAIMYRLNQGINEKLTPEDVSALNDLCGI